ncbi:MAG: hypothetical protein J5I41_01070 [Saprospiraceae bacterium]|nr:hypothetical protein [Saprospiraceae bacterium]
MRQTISRFWTAGACLLMALAATAQPKDNSPVSRYGVGDLYRGDFNQTGGSGGLFGAWTDPYRVNPVNPASLSFLQSTSLEVGFFGKMNDYQRNSAKQRVWSGNLDYLSLAFPLRSRINELMEPGTSPWEYATGVHVAPYSLVGYDVEFEQFVPDVDTIRNIFQGTGGLTQAAWSAGVKYRDFSAGVQVSYVFGSLNNNYQLDLQTVQSPYSTRSFTTTSLRAFPWTAGVIYRLPLDPASKDNTLDRRRRWVQFGLYGGSQVRYHSLTDQLIERVNADYSSGGAPLARDTIRHITEDKGNGFLPGRIGAGVTYRKGDFFQVGINAEYRNWSVFRLPDTDVSNLSYRNTWRLSAGGEWTPDPTAFRQYLRKVSYRAGLFYEQDARVIDGENLTGYGLQAGMGFPVILPRQQVSFLELAVEIGRRGVTQVQQDNYIRLRVAATLNDNSWFFQRKYQ